MTLVEARDLLKNRIGFNDTYDTTALTLPDTENSTSQSGRWFQDEFYFITLENISETMHKAPVDNAAFNAHLTRIRLQAIMFVLSDVFFNEITTDTDITLCAPAFDNAISKRLGIMIAEQILTTRRKNYAERLGKDYLSALFFELKGNNKENIAEYNPDYPTNLGLKSRYGNEIKRIRDMFEVTDMLNVNTVGLGRNDELYDRDHIIVYD